MTKPINQAEVVRLSLEEKMTCVEIAQQLGCHAATVGLIRKKNGIVGPMRKAAHLTKRPTVEVLERELPLGRDGIAEKYGVNKGTVSEWVKYCGLTFSKARRIDTDRVRILADSGKSATEIATEIDRTVSGVVRHCKAHNIDLTRGVIANKVRPDRAELKALCRNVPSIIAKVYNVHPVTVKNWLLGYGLSAAPEKGGKKSKAEWGEIDAVAAKLKTDVNPRKPLPRIRINANFSASPAAVALALAKHEVRAR